MPRTHGRARAANFQTPHSPTIFSVARDLGLECVDGLVEGEDFLLFRAEAAHSDRAILDFALADGEQHRHLGDAVLADLVGDFLVAEIGLGPEAARSEFGDYLGREIICVGRDRQDLSPGWVRATAAGCPHGARSGCR